MIPAQSKGAAPARSRFDGNAQNKPLVDDDAVGVAAVGDASEVFVRQVVGKDHIGAELLKPRFALRTGAVRIHHASDRGEVTGLELGDRRASLGDAADDLVARDARVDGRHHAAPLVANLMEIGVTDTAEKNFDLDIVFGGIAPHDLGGG